MHYQGRYSTPIEIHFTSSFDTTVMTDRIFIYLFHTRIPC